MPATMLSIASNAVLQDQKLPRPTSIKCYNESDKPLATAGGSYIYAGTRYF